MTAGDNVAVTYLDVPVLGHPRAQPRPRVYGKRVVTDSPATVAWKTEVVRSILAVGWTRPADDAALELDLEVAMPTVQPGRWNRPAITGADIDNLVKAIADSMMDPKGRDLRRALDRLSPAGRAYRGLIADDAQIVTLRATKRWSQRPGGARILLRDASSAH